MRSSLNLEIPQNRRQPLLLPVGRRGAGHGVAARLRRPVRAVPLRIQRQAVVPGGRPAVPARPLDNRVLCEKEVCRKVLRAALGIEVGEIAYLNAEQAKEPAAASRGVRMDAFAREGSRVFGIEMQVSPEDAAYRDEMLAEFGLERAE